MIQWQYFPKSRRPPDIAHKVVDAFSAVSHDIDSKAHQHKSDQVLVRVSGPLRELGFNVEAGKKSYDKIAVPVLFGLNGRPEKSFHADAVHLKDRFVIEVEAGRAIANNQFLKDLFQACMMDEIEYLGLAIRNTYRRNGDFDHVCVFLDTLYASRRLDLPLRGILVIGY
jgi:hypothetical protein